MPNVPPPELICVSADAGLEPASFRSEVTHSHATGAVTNARLGKSVRGFISVSLKTGDGADSNCTPLRVPRRIRTLRHWHILPVMQGNGRFSRRESFYRRSIRVLHHSLLQAFAAFDRLSGFSRGTTRWLFSSGCEQKPGAADDAIPRRLHLVTELEDGSHCSFLCFRYSATGRLWISREKTEYFICICETHKLCRQSQLFVNLFNSIGRRLWLPIHTHNSGCRTG